MNYCFVSRLILLLVCLGAAGVRGDDTFPPGIAPSVSANESSSDPSPAQSRTGQFPAVALPGFQIGVNVHLSPQAHTERILPVLRSLGVTSIRFATLWVWVEKEKGKLDIGQGFGKLDSAVEQANSSGIQPLIILGLGNALYDQGGFPLSPEAQDAFVRYVEAVAKHYKGAVKQYEVWNEWNIGMGVPGHPRGDPGAYAGLLERVYVALKHVDPEIVVVGGAVAVGGWEWANRLIKTKAVDGMDVFSVHPYAYPAVPEKVVAWLDALEDAAKRSTNGRELPLYMTEIGWPTHKGPKGLDESLVADYLARLYLLAPTRSFVKGVWWYDLFEDGVDPANFEHHFGLVRPDNSLKPAACALTEVAKLLRDYKPVSARRGKNNVWVVKYTSGREFVYAVWAEDPAAKVQASIVTADPAGTTMTARGVCRDVSAKGNGSDTLEMTVTASPVLLSTNANDIVVR